MLRPVEPALQPAAVDETAEYLERVRALTPRIAAAGPAIERDRRIPADLMDAVHDAAFFRMLMPRSVGGAEVHPLTFMQTVEAIAGSEASLAWNICQNAVCAIMAASMPVEAARTVFGAKDAILAWGPPEPDARADVEGDGYRVSGTFNFASGMRHATWLGAYCPIFEPDGSPRTDADGKPVRRVMIFPAQHADVTDVWDVIGLRGTASDRFSVQDLYIPHAFSAMRDNLSEVREPGWLYSFMTTNLYACGFGSIALGVARTMLDAFMELAQEKTPRGYANRLRESAVTQSELAQAEARWRAARALLMQTMADICEAVQQTREATFEQRITIRLVATHAIQEARAVGNFAYEAAGATAIFTSNPFERRFRDLHTIAQQVQGRKSHYETVGRHLLGLDATSIFV